MKKHFVAIAVLLCTLNVSSPVFAATATTKKSAKPTAADRRKAALIDLYARSNALFVKRAENKTNVPIVPTEGKTIYTGVAYKNAVKVEQTDQIDSGVYYTGVTVEAFDFRIMSASTTAAVIRVCERAKSTGAFLKKDNSPTVDPFPVFVSDLELKAVYSAKTKRWLFSNGGYIETEQGRSKCADGK